MRLFALIVQLSVSFLFEITINDKLLTSFLPIFDCVKMINIVFKYSSLKLTLRAGKIASPQIVLAFHQLLRNLPQAN
ncbi:hypothetical protein MicvaDRAFT_2943 [Microcoleus vaginatus FGP-2]|nr:hypothetical protein MicvaDRAFT_2943 [Microcoleus vaginatus FGP-2]